MTPPDSARSTGLWKKLNLKDHMSVLVIDPPASFEPRLRELDGVQVHRSVASVERIGFAVVFATTQQQVDAAADAVSVKLIGDGILWFAYPKRTSKNLTCEFDRDTGWKRLGHHGFEPVRQVAIDDDWSALRFRRVEFISSLTRSFAISDEGKSRTQGAR